jgi:hypothetical protein
MNSESARIFALFPCFDKPSSGREQHMTCLDSSDQFWLEALEPSIRVGSATDPIPGHPARPRSTSVQSVGLGEEHVLP